MQLEVAPLVFERTLHITTALPLHYGAPMESSMSLSAREGQVLQSLLSGLTAREIANELGISFHTVRTHIRSIYMKTGVTNRLELLKWDLAGNEPS